MKKEIKPIFEVILTETLPIEIETNYPVLNCNNNDLTIDLASELEYLAIILKENDNETAR